MRPAVGIQTSLDELRSTPRIVDAMRAADDLAFAASRGGGVRAVRLLVGALSDEDDQITAIAAVHALAQVPDEAADEVLSALLSSERAFLREHAAWALAGRLPRFDAISRLIGLVVDGAFTGMIAQRTLQQWASSAPDHVAVALDGALVGIRDSDARYRVVETLGLVRGAIATSALVRIARDAVEDDAVRAAAVAGLGDRAGRRDVVDIVAALASGDGFVADVARLALVDLTATIGTRAPWQSGLTIAQLFLHADIDRELSRAGSGDNGGIATLLVRLGDALTSGAGTAAERPLDLSPVSGTDAAAAHDRVERVITLSRGTAADALASLSEVGSTVRGHAFAGVPLLSDPVPQSHAWPLRVAAERGIRRILRSAGAVDVLHLRMADVGTLAAANVARDLGIPVVFTVAPDPHAVIQSLEETEQLTRANYGDADEREHYWFRVRLVQRLAADAAHTVLFPRPNLAADIKALVGIDITQHPERHSIVPEGIDLDVVDRAVDEVRCHIAGAPGTPSIDELRDLLAALPAERRDLPLLISVGRMHRVKGMATIVEAWSSTALRDRTNLLVVGGDLGNPSIDEREQLDRIDAILPPAERNAAGLILPGNRPNDVVARWIAAARFGLPGVAAPGGVYVCGSIKEEFGIALLEALAAGLMVVAPAGGGPATYVKEDVTGFLTRTTDPVQLASAIRTALYAVQTESCEARAGYARNMVVENFTIQAMAGALGVVYAGVNDGAQELASWSVDAR